MNPSQALRVAIYARVSTSHHDQDPSVQTEELKRVCNARNWLVTHELVDHGYSGSTTERPALKRLLSLARAREIDGIVVLKLDRLFRSLKHLVITLEEFAALGVEFVATRDNVDWSTPSGRLFIQVLGSLAEFEKELLRERTLLGLAHAKANGKRLGRPKVRDDSAILELKGSGLSIRQIAAKLGISRGAVFRAVQPVPKTPENPEQESQPNQGEKSG